MAPRPFSGGSAILFRAEHYLSTYGGNPPPSHSQSETPHVVLPLAPSLHSCTQKSTPGGVTRAASGGAIYAASPHTVGRQCGLSDTVSRLSAQTANNFAFVLKSVPQSGRQSPSSRGGWVETVDTRSDPRPLLSWRDTKTLDLYHRSSRGRGGSPAPKFGPPKISECNLGIS